MSNLFKILYAPGEVFESIPERSGWTPPFIATLLLSCLLTAMIVNTIGVDRILRKQLREQPRLAEQLKPEKVEQIVRQANSPSRRVASFISTCIFTSLALLLIAALLNGLLHLLGAAASFRKTFSVTAYSFFTYYLVTFALTASVILISDKDSLDIDGVVKSHAGIFLDRGATNKALFSVATSLDLLSLGLLLILALGLSKVTAKLSFGKALGSVGSLWCMYVLVKAGLSTLL